MPKKAQKEDNAFHEPTEAAWNQRLSLKKLFPEIWSEGKIDCKKLAEIVESDITD